MKSEPSRIKQVMIFFVLAFAIGWLAFIPGVQYHMFPTPGAFIYLFSPALAALITVSLTEGTQGIKDLLGGYLRWRSHVQWYLVALLLLPAIFLFAAVISFGSHLGSLWTGSPWYFLIASFGFLMIINSGEEIGWRGFALSRLQGLIRNPLVAAVVLGAIWGLWHLPIYLNPQQSGFPLVLFLIFIAGISVIYSVLFNNTRGSLFLAVVLHASTDIPPRFLQIARFTTLSWSIIVVLTWVSAMVLYFATRNAAPVVQK